jgi:two-component system LytT family response regulator
MTQKSIQKQAPQLRISHQSETILLRRIVAEIQLELMELKNNINTVDKVDEKVVLLSNGKHHYISLNDIIYCEADGNYTKVYIRQDTTSNQDQSRSILIFKTLKSTGDLLDSGAFIRCHQSYMINKKYVTGYNSGKGLCLTLSNDKSIPVSRRNKTRVLALLVKLNFEKPAMPARHFSKTHSELLE